MFDSKFAERVDYCIYDCRRRTSGTLAALQRGDRVLVVVSLNK